MDQNKKDIIINLKEKITGIISLYESSKYEVENLKKELENLEIKKKNLEKNISELENKYNSLKLAKTLTGSKQDNAEAKSKINNIVREIDKCIALLNR